MGVTVINPANGTHDPATGVLPFGRLRLDFSGSVRDGHCAGDGFSFRLPDHLTIPAGTTFPLKTADGSTAAVLTVTGRTVTVSLTSYVEDHDNVTLNGWFQAQMDNQVQPG